MLNGLSGDFFVLKCLCECFFFFLFLSVFCMGWYVFGFF